MLYNKDWAYKLNPVADVLLKAADLLEKYGHVKLTRGNIHTGMCFLGALEVAQGHPEGYDFLGAEGPDTEITIAASHAVAKSLGLKVKSHESHHEWAAGRAMANWNNAPERTGQEVIDAMRNTAVKLMEKAHAV